MKVYEDFKGEYILIRKPRFWNVKTEFMVHETKEEIKLIKIECKEDKNIK